jgi:hypothetical protein
MALIEDGRGKRLQQLKHADKSKNKIFRARRYGIAGGTHQAEPTGYRRGYFMDLEGMRGAGGLLRGLLLITQREQFAMPVEFGTQVFGGLR